MDGSQPYNPRTVEEVFRDFKGRRAAIIKALTTDVEEFYQHCDPDFLSASRIEHPGYPYTSGRQTASAREKVSTEL
ncbi:alfin-like 4 [Actinidia rufa]|uniref:PHD finger protein ALFIN-LIKE n=1 Tax=Actinidia rufa TaxID=165716 RepID=A0A7J0GXL1_9ERIC|nr:alfin-like 4 [Actinidia rufa]